jgi:hypothetical protein
MCLSMFLKAYDLLFRLWMVSNVYLFKSVLLIGWFRYIISNLEFEYLKFEIPNSISEYLAYWISDFSRWISNLEWSFCDFVYLNNKFGKHDKFEKLKVHFFLHFSNFKNLQVAFKEKFVSIWALIYNDYL